MSGARTSSARSSPDRTADDPEPSFIDLWNRLGVTFQLTPPSAAAHAPSATRGRGTLDRIAQTERPRLLGLAYRLIGSRTEAEDAVREAMLRVHRSQVTDIGSPSAYLTTVTT